MESQPHELVAMTADTGTSAPLGQLSRATAYRRTIDDRAWPRLAAPHGAREHDRPRGARLRRHGKAAECGCASSPS